jgi:hypothetical protein
VQDTASRPVRAWDRSSPTAAAAARTLGDSGKRAASIASRRNRSRSARSWGKVRVHRRQKYDDRSGKAKSQRALRPPDKSAMIPGAPGAAPQAGEAIRGLRLGEPRSRSGQQAIYGRLHSRVQHRARPFTRFRQSGDARANQAMRALNAVKTETRPRGRAREGYQVRCQAKFIGYKETLDRMISVSVRSHTR